MAGASVKRLFVRLERLHTTPPIELRPLVDRVSNRFRCYLAGSEAANTASNKGVTMILLSVHVYMHTAESYDSASTNARSLLVYAYAARLYAPADGGKLIALYTGQSLRCNWHRTDRTHV